MKSIAALILNVCFATILIAQNTTIAPNANSESKFTPKGFLGVAFGSNPEDAFQQLLAQGYKESAIRKFDYHIEMNDFALDDLNIEESILKFNDKNQMYYGKAKIKIVSEKSTDASVEVYNKIKRSIEQKYRKTTKNSSRLKAKDKKNYWSDSWEFKDKNNKFIIAEIKLWKDEDWFHDGKWRRESLICMEYSSHLAPLNPDPNPGSLSEAL